MPGEIDKMIETLRFPPLIDAVRRPFVSISGRYTRVGSDGETQEKHFASSAFVVETADTWFLLTAGHIINDLKTLHADERVKDLRCSLADYFSKEARVKEPTPLTWDSNETIALDVGEAETGIDIGIVRLHDFYKTSLASNGVKPMKVATWRGANPPQCDAYAVLGLPEQRHEHISPRNGRGGGISAELTLVALKPILPITPSLPPRLVAEFLDDGELNSVSGLSGGPIIGVNRTEDGGRIYAAIAVQSSWRRGERKVFGTPISPMLERIEHVILAARGRECP